MSERRYQGSIGKQEAIKRDLESSGIESPGEWREALDLETPLKGEKGFNIERGKDTTILLDYLGETQKKEDEQAIEKFGKTADSIEKLEILRTLSISDAIRCLKNHSGVEAQWRYLEGRLDFYQKFIQGKATRKQTEQEWDSVKGEYKNVVKEYQLDASGATPETVRLGILRDTLFAAMVGTPELGIFKVAEKRLKNKNVSKTHMPLLKGHHSGIHEGSIGYAYPFLRKLYEKARGQVQHKVSDRKIDEQALEHKSVILAANWLEEAMDYNDPARSPHSPYAAGIEEGVAWVRLGDGVKKQLRGMRRKIQGVDLTHIERFIGKSGVDKYDSEHKRLFGQIKFLKEGYDQDKKQEFTTKENGFAVDKQQKWYEGELERLNHKFEKSKAQIEKLELPDEERELQLQSVMTRHEESLANLQADYEAQTARLKDRTSEQLLVDLEQRQVIVNERHEKRKSLAQKALDLHFSINHTGGDYNSKPLAGLVDWINYAPLGTIKRSHKMLRQNSGEDAITTYALADIIAGARGATREDLKVIEGLVQKAKGQDYAARQKLEAMSKVGNIVSQFDYEVSLADVEDMAGKGFHGMTEALKMYGLEQVKQFMDKGINLQSVTTARKATQKFGHDLSSDQIGEIAAHNIEGLEDAMRIFDLAAVTTLLRQDVNLPTAVAVLNNTKQFGYELTVPQIAKVAKNVRDINDFTAALRGLPLDEVEKLFAVGISYQDLSTVKVALEKYNSASDFNSSLTVAQKLAKHNEYGNLDGALAFYSLQEVEQIIAKGVPLAGLLEVRRSLEEKQVATTLQETMLLAQYAGEWNRGYNLTQSIDAFGIENVRKMATKSCKLDKALEVNNYITGHWILDLPDSTLEALRRGGVDVIIAIVKAGSIEAAVKTLAAGFTVEEVTRFPHLISSLVVKP